MKFSQFNSIIPYGNKFALYNAFQKKVVFLVPQLKNILDREIQGEIDNLRTIYPDFYNILLENSYIIKDDIDEVDIIKKFVYSIDENKKQFDLTINPTMNCNFRCWYCYETHINQSKMSADTINKIIKLIHKIAQDKEIEVFNIGFFGGEPLLYFKENVIPIIDKFISIMEIFDKKFTIGFTSNSYLFNDEILGYFNDKKLKPHFHITLDGYRDNHDKVRFVSKTKGSYSIIINNIKKIVENEMFVRARINYTDENIEDTYKIADDLLTIKKEKSKKYLLVDFHRVWQNLRQENVENIVDRNVEIMKNKGINAKSSTYLNDTVRGSCYADKRNSAVINFNGDVYKCTSRDFKTENREGFLTDEGEIVWENNSLERRMKVKFNNPPCLVCRILPICNGACSQIALERSDKHDYCVHSFNDKEKDKVVKAMVGVIMNSNNIYEHF